MHNGENASFATCLYKQCKHHTRDAFSVYKWIHFGTTQNIPMILIFPLSIENNLIF